MKIGTFDFGMKHITFRSKTDGKMHWIGFQYTWRKGIQEVWFDGCPAEITDAYPPLLKAIQKFALIIFLELKFILIKFFRKRKALHRSNKLNRLH